ncbi:hypothetical protein JW948_10770 [bacterium]|nr:hypothetical protein [bacterium]
MKITKRKLWKHLFRMLMIGLLFCSVSAYAVSYTVSGQVMRITTEDAEDDAIPDAVLTGEYYPYPHIRIYNSVTNMLLAEGDGGQNGQFTILFTAPAGLSIQCRVFRVIDGMATELPAARSGINTFTSIPAIKWVALKVTADHLDEYGAGGFVPYPGVGVVFTRVGRVEIPYIEQAAGNALRGLAHYATAADSLVAVNRGIPVFRKAPFGGKLLIYGSFGNPGGGLCPTPGSTIDWYRVKIQRISPTIGTAFYCMDYLSKIRTEVITSPFSVGAYSEKIGPFTGELSDATAVPGLFRVNRDVTGPIVNYFYSYPDLRVNWNSGANNGLYRISLEYYMQTGTTAAGKPVVQQFSSTCFTGTSPDPDVALHEIYLNVNNQSLQTHFDHIFISRDDPSSSNPADRRYYADGGSETGSIAGAYDFNDEGLCSIMDLESKYDVDFYFTAHHAGSFMRSYDLHIRSNDSGVNITPVNESFVSHTPGTSILWEGTPAAGTHFRVPLSSFTDPCAYVYTLNSYSRIQNGVYYLQYHHPYKAYYVIP